MNFFFQRNPRHLVEQAGMLGVYGPEEEKIFLSRVEAMDAALLRPLVLVVGGFMDQGARQQLCRKRAVSGRSRRPA